jgi:high affinity sulfate transporter 1
MNGVAARVVPPWLLGYNRGWLSGDVIAGLTLAAVAIPECMGYTTIAQMPIVTGLYTIIFPTLVFVLLGSSRLMVVGADSATAAIFSAGLAGLGIAGLQPNSAEWVAWASLVALVCGGLLALARIFRLGFLADFLSASVLIGFLTGVGIQVLTGQIPDMLGISKGTGNWFSQQWHTLTHLTDVDAWTLGFALGTVAIIVGCKRLVPRVPGALIAVVAFIALSAATDAAGHGVTTVGSVPAGFPPIGFPSGIDWGDAPKVVGIAVSCFVLIIAQSAATSRSFAMKHDQQVDINRDLVGLSGAELAAGLTGTFVVNGSPTKTQILDEQKGRTQIANLTLALVTLAVTLWLTGLLTDMPTSVLAAIVFLVGIDLIDVTGMKRVAAYRRSEVVVAAVTAVTVFAVGVEQGIVLAIVLSILELVRRQYSPRNFVIGLADAGHPHYEKAVPGAQSAPGLIVFRYDAPLFYANASRFAEDVRTLIDAAPTPVRWLVLDCSSIDDVDYSAGQLLGTVIEGLHRDSRVFALAGPDPALIDTLRRYGTLDHFDNAHIFPDVASAVAAFAASTGASGEPSSR